MANSNLSNAKKAKNDELIDRALGEWKVAIVFPLVVYLFGWCVAWIRRGFAKK